MGEGVGTGMCVVVGLGRHACLGVGTAARMCVEYPATFCFLPIHRFS